MNMYMNYVFGIGVIMLWSQGFLFPYTYIGFLEILMALSLSIFLLNKLPKLKLLFIKAAKRDD